MQSSIDPNAGAATQSRHDPATTSKILIVEDDERMIHALEATLKGEGYEVLIAQDGVEALKAMQVERPDMVILNTALPWLGSAQARRESRASQSGPAIIALDVKGNATEDVRRHADDYVTKPFHAKDILARVKALRHRTSVGVLRTGPIEMDLEHGTVRVGGRVVALTGKEFNLLRRLLEAKGRILTRNVLREIVWEHASDHFETRTVDVHIGRLRQKLGAAGRYVITVRGMGYRCFA
jgi:DNA-binding response OmpR family regulator